MDHLDPLPAAIVVRRHLVGGQEAGVDQGSKDLRRVLDEMGLELLGWRDVPTVNESLGATAVSAEPIVRQMFIRRPTTLTQDQFERKLMVMRKYATRMVRESTKTAEDFYIVSLSSRTLNYKGMLTPEQVPAYYPDLLDEAFESAIALIHSRFSTNTLPSWPLAHPYRTLAHNGEINTIRGNANWMRSREAILESELFSADELQKRGIQDQATGETSYIPMAQAPSDPKNGEKTHLGEALRAARKILIEPQLEDVVLATHAIGIDVHEIARGPRRNPSPGCVPRMDHRDGSPGEGLPLEESFQVEDASDCAGA